MNCCVAPLPILGFTGVMAIEVSVAAGVLDPPPLPPPLQLMISKGIKIKKDSLFNFINADPLRHQSRRVGAALHFSHMSPFFHDDII